MGVRSSGECWKGLIPLGPANGDNRAFVAQERTPTNSQASRRKHDRSLSLAKCKRRTTTDDDAMGPKAPSSSVVGTGEKL
jgi:hypothetical protein